jgi:DNA-binding NarL/FixJ family response regulator
LQLAAIGAIASIRPNDAKQILIDLTDSDDEEIVEAAQEAMVMAATLSDVSEEEGEWENGKWTA